MAKDRFVYVPHPRTPPETLWDALLTPEFPRQYWFGVTLDSDWKKGSAWKMVSPDGTVTDRGEVVEVEKPTRIVLKWLNEWRPELNAEGFSRCTMEIEPVEGATKLTV